MERSALHSPRLSLCPHGLSATRKQCLLRRRGHRNAVLKLKLHLNRNAVVALTSDFDSFMTIEPVVHSISTALYSVTVIMGAAWIGQLLLAPEQDRLEDRDLCPRCNGTGVEPCLCTRWSDGDVGCQSCNKTGLMKCSSCGGGGTAVPIALFARKDKTPPTGS